MILGPYTRTYKQILNYWHLPIVLEVAHISPLSKTSHPTSPSDARPVPLLPEKSKLLKK